MTGARDLEWLNTPMPLTASWLQVGCLKDGRILEQKSRCFNRKPWDTEGFNICQFSVFLSSFEMFYFKGSRDFSGVSLLERARQWTSSTRHFRKEPSQCCSLVHKPRPLSIPNSSRLPPLLSTPSLPSSSRLPHTSLSLPTQTAPDGLLRLENLKLDSHLKTVNCDEREFTLNQIFWLDGPTHLESLIYFLTAHVKPNTLIEICLAIR